MNKIKILFLLGALCPLFAREELETIIIEDSVKAKQRYKEDMFFKTYSSELVTKQNIEEDGISNPKDALKNISNVKVKDMGTFVKNISIRGFSAERVASVVDGSKLSNHGITMAGGGELSLVDTSNIEKIEVIKGSPSVLYDPGAIGGVIKVTTLKDISKIEDKVRIKYNYLHDESYKLDKHSSLLETKYKDFYINFFGSKGNSKNLNVKDQKKLQGIIENTNLEDERDGTEFELHDLGYESDSYGGMIGYKINPQIDIFLKADKYEANDISFAHGSANPKVIHYDEYSKKNWLLGVNTKNYLQSNYVNLMYSNQDINRLTKTSSNTAGEVELQSKTAKLETNYIFNNLMIISGIEYTQDNAKTLTYSEQDYKAGYFHGEYILDNWTFNSGIRYNNYKVTQNLLPGKNPDTAYDLVGVSGVLKHPLKDNSFNYSAGILYSLNNYNNIAFNYSTSYRYPSLYERFAFDAFIGGGEDMKAEEAKNYELSYKHLENNFDFNVALFYSDFKTYNSVYRKVSIKNPEAFKACNKDPKCNPFDGDKNEKRIFDSNYIFGSFDDVSSYGFDFNINKILPQYQTELGFAMGMTKIGDATKKFGTQTLKQNFSQEPIEFSFFAKKRFAYTSNPWIKLKIRHVTDSSNVKQDGGFSPFTVADIFFGAKYKYLNINAGIKNITNKVYHEPYMLLDGAKRSFFVNFSISYEKLL